MMPRILKGLILPITLILLWEFAARTGFIIAESMSFPSAIAAAGYVALRDGSLFKATQETFGAARRGSASPAASPSGSGGCSPR
jgi:ABC-type nitrate/sulfonate/bicarbonate transport system permease component